MKKILLTFSIFLVAISCSKPIPYSDILAEDKVAKTKFESHLRYENDKMNVFGNASGFTSINVKLTRKGNLMFNKNLPVSANGYFQTYLEDVQKGDKLCLQDTNCSDL